MHCPSLFSYSCNLPESQKEGQSDDIAADNTLRMDDVVDTRAGDGTRADFAADNITGGDDTACKGNNAAAVDVNIYI